MKTYKNNQEVFDSIWKTFVVENTELNKACVYSHHPKGCFIGSLLTSKDAQKLDDITKKVKTYNIENLLDQDFSMVLTIEEFELMEDLLQSFCNCSTRFLKEIQGIHDSAVTDKRKDVKEQLIALAKFYGLTTEEQNEQSASI